MTHTINSRQARETWSALLKSTQAGERHIITISDIPIAALVPVADMQRLEVQVSQIPPPSYAQIDADRRTQFKRETLDRIQALVGRDKLEALRLLTELQTELLANGAQP